MASRVWGSGPLVTNPTQQSTDGNIVWDERVARTSFNVLTFQMENPAVLGLNYMCAYKFAVDDLIHTTDWITDGNLMPQRPNVSDSAYIAGVGFQLTGSDAARYQVDYAVEVIYNKLSTGLFARQPKMFPGSDGIFAGEPQAIPDGVAAWIDYLQVYIHLRDAPSPTTSGN
jgi:hypothetical protein